MVYAIYPTSKDIQHHGVLGMKWGVRRYQPYSVVPRGSGKGGKEIGLASDSNPSKSDIKAAKKNVKAAYKNAKKVSGYINRYEFNKKEFERRYNDIKNTSKTDEEKDSRIAKLESKYSDKNGKKYEKYNKYKSIMDEAVKQTIDADSILGEKKVDSMLNNRKIRDMAVGGTVGFLSYGLITAAVAGATGYIFFNPALPVTAITTGAGAAGMAGNRLMNNRQKAKNKLTKSNQEKYDRASKKDRWDIDFLESIQNTKMFNDGDTQSMLKEYNKYLYDPDDYIRNRSVKLKQA